MITICEGLKCLLISKINLVIVAILFLLGCAGTAGIKEIPIHAYDYLDRGFIYSQKGQYDKAISDYNKALEINPNYVEAYNNRANIYYKQGQYDKAISDYNKAIEINTSFSYAYNNRGNVYSMIGQYDKACPDYKQACELGDCSGYNWAKKW
jgi:tetratricopeptide (TPR) repeat protein